MDAKGFARPQTFPEVLLKPQLRTEKNMGCVNLLRAGCSHKWCEHRMELHASAGVGREYLWHVCLLYMDSDYNKNFHFLCQCHFSVRLMLCFRSLPCCPVQSKIQLLDRWPHYWLWNFLFDKWVYCCLSDCKVPKCCN